MNHRQAALIILVGASLAAGTATAADIYRYVDAEGNVNYVDRPSGADTEERLSIVSNRSNTPRPQAPEGAPENRETGEEPVNASDKKAPTKATRAEIRAKERERERECQAYRDQMETLTTARRLYRQDEAGERVYLDESELQAARDQAQALIQENCR